MVVAVLVLPESPKYLYSKQRFDEARDSLKYIAKINGKKMTKNFEEKDESHFPTSYIFDTEVVH